MESYEEIETLDGMHPYWIAFSDTPARMRPHWHDSFELMYFYETDGCRYTIRGVSYAVQSGDLLLANPLESHSCEDFGKARVCCLRFRAALLLEYSESLFVGQIAADTTVARIFAELFAQRDSAFFSLTVMQGIYALSAHLLEHDRIGRDPFAMHTLPQRKNVQAAIDYMEAHHAESLSVADVARAVHWSESRLSHMFRSVTGLGVAEYMEHIRLRHARRLLTDSDMSIAEIALACGFSDHSYFARRFRRLCDVTPLAWRKGARRK